MKPVRFSFPLLRLPAACLLAVSLNAAEPVPPTDVPAKLDLPMAISYALEHNFAIRQARERIRQQDGVVVEVSARKIPGVSADAAYQRNDKDISSGIPASDQAWQINLYASQVLYAGGGVDSSVKSVKLAREAALLDLQAVINEALLQVRIGYYNVLLARERIQVQESNLELLQQQLKTASDRFEAGTVSSFEKLRAEVAVANAKVPLITARNDFRLAIEFLRQALGFMMVTPETSQKVPEFEGTLAFTPQSFDLKAAFEAARANRPDLERIARLTDSQTEAVTVARSTFYPSVSAFGGYTLRKGGSNNFGDSNQGWLAGVQGKWAIFDGKATAGRVAQAKSSLEQVKLTLAEAQLAVEVEVRRAYSRWQQATELAAASIRVIEQAEESLRLANARYLAGTATQLDVLAAQVDLTTARSNQIEAYFGYNVAVATMRKAMGQADEFVKKP
jgi:outer membrane protein TolC